MRALALVVAFVALVLGGCGGERDEAAPPPPAPETEATSTDDADRPQAPSIEGAGLNGKPVSLADIRGRPVLVNVWSSW